MKSNKRCFLILILLLVTSCSGGGSSSDGSITSSVTLSSITVTSASPSIYYVNATEQFTATGTYSDNTTQNLTTSVVWSSSDTTVATISNAAGSNGMVTSLATGKTTIKALLGSVSGSTVLTVTSSTATPNNILTVTVNGTASYPNKPLVSVTVCSPSTATCKTIDDILLDTGSYGLRIFGSLLKGISLTQATSGSGSLAECIQYSDSSADWGPVQTAVVVLGNEPAVTVPIQVIDYTFGNPKSCTGNLDTTPAEAGYNGILGVGLFVQDCGSACESPNSNNGQYYSCSGLSCTGTAASISSQVQNPVALLQVDNNGVIVELPSLPLGGSPSVNGSLILGIGTQTNNQPSAGVTAYPTDNVYGEFTTIFEGSSLTSSFIDTGSNSLSFPSKTSSYNLTGQLPDCKINPGWFCPAVTPPAAVAYSAINGAIGSPTVNFQIGNADDLFSSTNNVFVELGGEGSAGSFDWGLPFFFGRYVYIGIEGTSSSLGSGPYFAY